MKKLFSILMCILLTTGLIACSSNAEKGGMKALEPKKEEKQKEEPKTQEKEDTVGKIEDIRLKDLDKFQMLQPEYQLAIVIALFNKAILMYDHGIGNAEFLLYDKMTDSEIKVVHGVLQNQVKQFNPKIEELIYESQALLQQVTVSNKNELQQLADAKKNYLKTVDEMISCLESVTVGNARESRGKMNQLKKEYLQHAAEIGFVSIDIVQNTGLDIALYRHIVTGLLKQ
ncbi:hypothetical protein [Priestia taiwanensis]|uniref:Uncharacterized protein n=1 Tax=Priestia taiwanensis TaxID=1347902 RepID=A0A917ALW3_9BACI|nr:hypothetical protein [Priestia taiwanensis]MBM7362308.1 hypothetical protein [Priestia taiwanensis]GGE61133.1 hypothetical protein GCM10007140_09310 [Priestia taiwanensis]